MEYAEIYIKNNYFNDEEEYEDILNYESELFYANQHYLENYDEARDNSKIGEIRKEAEKYIDEKGITTFQKLYNKFSNNLGIYQFYEMVIAYLENLLVIEQIMPVEFTNLQETLIRKRGMKVW